MPPRVAVIGAGPLGLMSIKNLKEEGFDVTGYEARPYVGGIWQYSNDSYLSTAATTIFNSSRYRSSISDFPFPADTDDFPTWQQMNKYMESYCDHFELRGCINLNSPISNLTRKDNQWLLQVSPKDQPSRVDKYDKVVVAIGTFVRPKYPQKFPGMDQFKGSTTHAMNFHDPAQYKGKNVLLVGLHASAQDVAVGLKGVANKIYGSHKNGLLMVRRERFSVTKVSQTLTRSLDSPVQSRRIRL